MIYALLNRNTSMQDRQRIAQAIEERRSDVLRQYSESGIVRHIMDIDLRDHYYCIHCTDRLMRSRRNPPAGQRAAHPWHFMHYENNQCIGHEHNISNSIYLNPNHHGCYVQRGCPETHPYTSCHLRRDCNTSYCHYAFTANCPV